MHGLIFNISSHGTRTIGAYRIAHVLRTQGWDIEVIDFCQYWDLVELQELAKSRINGNTAFVGFSFLFSSLTAELQNFVTWIRTCYPDVLIMSGGGVNPQFDTSCFDVHISGFGEVAVQEVLKWRTGNGSRPRFELRSGNCKIVDANKQYPAYPLPSLMIKYEDRDFIEPEEWLTIEFSRGCKFKCAFCNFPILGVKGDYSRDADDARLQLQDAYDRFGVTNYLVTDETFNDRTEKIAKFADAVEQLSFTPWFSGFIRADLLISRPRDREELLRMNFLGQYYGIESFNPQAVKMIGKGMNPDKVKQGLLDIKQYFMSHGTGLYRGTVSLIIGLAKENAQSLEDTLQWLVKHWQAQAVEYYVLEIPANPNDSHSLISRDYQKYGYRQYDKNDLNANKSGPWSLLGTFMTQDFLNWEHDDLNIEQALEIKQRWNAVLTDPGNDFRTSTFLLSDVGRKMSVQERLKLGITAYHDSFYTNADWKEFIARYKFKKLSPV